MENNLMEIPPLDMTAELAVIGSLLLDNKLLPKVLNKLDPEDFFDRDLRNAYRIIRDLFMTKDPDLVIDNIVLMNTLKEKRLWNRNISNILAELTDTMKNPGNVGNFVKSVKDRSHERKLITSAERLALIAADQSLTLADRQAALSQSLLDLGKTSRGKSIIHLREMAGSALELIRTQVQGIPSGFWRLDQIIHGFSPGELVLIAGRPSMGKSSFMMNLALYAARNGHKPLIISMEMSERSLLERIICMIANVPLDNIRSDEMDAEQRNLVESTITVMSQLDLFLHTESGLSPAELFTLVKLMQIQHGVDCVFVDYLQLMRADNRHSSKNYEVSEISMQLLAMAIQLQIPVIVLSQLSRASETRETRRPKLTDLRESGSLEQDAHKVLLLHREDYYLERENPEARLDGKAICIVAKNRQGRCGDVGLTWIPQYFYFTEEVFSDMLA